MLQPMLTIPEVARRTGKHPETIRRWVRSGRLRSTRVGTQHLIDEEDLEAITAEPERLTSALFVRTVTGEPMPNFLAALDRSRSRR